MPVSSVAHPEDDRMEVIQLIRVMMAVLSIVSITCCLFSHYSLLYYCYCIVLTEELYFDVIVVLSSMRTHTQAHTHTQSHNTIHIKTRAHLI